MSRLLGLPPTEQPLTRAWRDWAANAGHTVLNCYESGIPAMDPMREAFFAGAATMAQLILADEPVWNELRELKRALAEYAQRVT